MSIGSPLPSFGYSSGLGIISGLSSPVLPSNQLDSSPSALTEPTLPSTLGNSALVASGRGMMGAFAQILSMLATIISSMTGGSITPSPLSLPSGTAGTTGNVAVVQAPAAATGGGGGY